MLLRWNEFNGEWCNGYPIGEEDSYRFRINFFRLECFELCFSTDDSRVELGYDGTYILDIGRSLEHSKELCEKHWQKVKMDLLRQEYDELSKQIADLEKRRDEIEDQINSF